MSDLFKRKSGFYHDIHGLAVFNDLHPGMQVTCRMCCYLSIKKIQDGKHLVVDVTIKEPYH